MTNAKPPRPRHAVARASLAVVLAAACGWGAHAQPRSASVAYDVYTGGLQVLELEASLSVDASSYQLSASMRSRGFLAMLFSWDQVNRVSGVIAASSPAPRRFEQRGNFRGKQRSVEIDYADGRIARLDVAPTGDEDGDREPVAMADVAGALDPLTGIMALLLRLDAGGGCDGRYAGFDGRRSFNVEMIDRGLDAVELPGARGGPARARVCDFVYRQTGGYARRVYWGPDRQREPREGRLWIGDPRQLAPGLALERLPLRMEFENSFGRMLAHLRPVAPR